MSASSHFETGSRSLRPDAIDAEYILWLGTSPGTSGKRYQMLARDTVMNLHKGTSKMDVFDPVLGNGCCLPTEKNISWHPIRTATNNHLALGLIRWMIENKAHNTDYLSYPNYKAAMAAGYASFTGASFLVITDEGHANKGKFLKAVDAGLEEPPAPADAKTPPVYYVVVNAETGEAALNSDVVHGVIDYEGEVNGIKVRSAFLFLKDSAMEHTMEEYAEFTGVPVGTIEAVAREFTSHGTKAACTGLGSTACANGLNSMASYTMLNAMVGSNQMDGGMVPRRVGASTTADGKRYKLATVKGKPAVTDGKTATNIGRTKIAWQKTEEYKNRVEAGEKDPKPRLPWFTYNGVSDNQALVSVIAQYPYQAKILVSWMTNTLQATPGALRDTVIDRLKDTSVVPLHIACDVVVGEHAQLADYIVPDTNPFESWGVVTNEGFFKGKGNSVRWPAKKPDTIEISGDRHASFEAFCCDVAKVCDLPGFGDAACTDAAGNAWPINDACDYFLKAAANLAYDTEPVADVSSEDVKMQALDELPAAWKKAVSEEEWPKVLNVLSRGGRFWPIGECVDDKGRSKYALSHLTQFYSERLAVSKNPYSGLQIPPTMSADPERLADGTPVAEKFSETEFPFRSTNYKPRFRSISFLANSPIMRDLCDHNYLEINRDDAVGLGIHDGDAVKITSATGDVMEGEAMVRAGIAAGTFGVAYGYGHKAYGAQDVNIEGEEARSGNPAIAAGVHLQTMVDPTVEEEIYLFADPEASTPARSGGMYKIEKA